MGWNYRIFKHTDKNPNHEKGSDITSESFVWYGIHEVYYKDDNSDDTDENEIDLISSDPINPHGQTVEDLKSDIDLMLEAFDKPVLDYNDLLDKLKHE